jgi:hypothetical protein
MYWLKVFVIKKNKHNFQTAGDCCTDGDVNKPADGIRK